MTTGSIGALTALLLAAVVATAARPAAAVDSPAVAAPARVRFEWVMQGGSTAARVGALRLEGVSASPLAASETAGASRPLSLAVDGEAAVVGALPPGSRWSLSVAIPGYWARPEIVEAGAAGAESVHRIELWPTGRVAGVVRMADRQEPLVSTITVANLLSPLPARKPGLGEQRFACPVDERGRFACELPADGFDLALSADGFVPEYRWAASVAAGRTYDAGTVVLQRGASLAGWVTVEDGVLSPSRCTVRLVPMIAPGGGRQGVQIEKTAGSAPVRKDGFFQLRGVAPGSYLLQAEQPGLAPARAFPIAVWPGAESLIKQPLVLRRPLTLELAITPAIDWLGKPWQVRVVRLSDFSANLERRAAYEAAASREGRVVVPGQSPGRYLVDVRDSLGNSLSTDPQLEVTGPDDARREIAIDLVSVEGKLLLGKNPLAATIWFGSPFSTPGVKMSADDKGRFQGVLPRGGRWEVRVESAEPALRASRSTRVVPDRAGRAKVEIDLPDVRLFGHVVDEDGQPVAGAEVGMDMERCSDSVRTDASGSFSSRGLDTGLVTLVAKASAPPGKSLSDAATALLRDGEETGPIELRLRRMRTLTGRVVSPLGPVVGASVAAVPAGSARFEVEESPTDLTGSFSVQLPAQTASAFVYVSAPGDAFRAFQVPVDGSPATLAVDADSGALEVAIPYSRDEMDEQDISPPWFLQNGIPVPAAFLRRWALGHGEAYADAAYTSLRVGNLAPGGYQVCFAARPSIVAAHRAGWASPPGRCAAGTLGSGATLRLVPERDEARPRLSTGGSNNLEDR